jgi:hypothetical protein
LATPHTAPDVAILLIMQMLATALQTNLEMLPMAPGTLIVIRHAYLINLCNVNH